MTEGERLSIIATLKHRKSEKQTASQTVATE
jgi:hypothetical protein